MKGDRFVLIKSLVKDLVHRAQFTHVKMSIIEEWNKVQITSNKYSLQKIFYLTIGEKYKKGLRRISHLKVCLCNSKLFLSNNSENSSKEDLFFILVFPVALPH